MTTRALLSRRSGCPFTQTDAQFTYDSTLRLGMLGSPLAPDFVTEGWSVILTGNLAAAKPIWKPHRPRVPERAHKHPVYEESYRHAVMRSKWSRG